MVSARAGAWRLVEGPDADGPMQMALDRAILEARAAGEVPPTLRLYRFEPSAITIGRFQHESQVDLDWCRDSGLGVARRPTGGRGVLHDDELTYAMVAHRDDGVPSGTAASYRHLCGPLVSAYERIGVAAELTRRPRGEASSGACYLHATPADLSLGAAKLSGSAQVWHESAVLQHGSFVIDRDIEREARAFRLDEAEERELRRTTTTLVDILEARPSLTAMADALVAGVEEAFGVSLERGPLTPGELERARRLVEAHDVLSVRPTEGQGIVQLEGV